MAGYKNPSFQERAALSAESKKKALEKLRAKPPVDPQVAAELKAARLAREAAEDEARAAKKAAIEQARIDAEEAKAAKIAEAAAAAEAAKAKLAASLRVPNEAERKAARDARYAARKSRK
jgi:hypothetical protein